MTAADPRAWPAPAKLNLFLHIIGRRPDGYHLLQTVFQFLDFGDSLTLEVRADGGVRRRDALPGVPEERDLTVRAARLLQAETGCPLGAEIGMVKRIPLGGGLGGGSSDAATVLVALDHLWGLGLGEDRLAELGLRLGADVPVFVRGRAAWAEGVGERLLPVDLPEPWFVVVKPPVSIDTAAVFALPELTRDSPLITMCDFLAGEGRNDCQRAVVGRYPAVGEALDRLARHGPARLTGTGACVFAAVADRGSARTALQGLPAGWWGIAARGLNRSPLAAELARRQAG